MIWPPRRSAWIVALAVLLLSAATASALDDVVPLPPGDGACEGVVVATQGPVVVPTSAPASAQDPAKQDKPAPKLAGAEISPGKPFDPFPADKGWKPHGALTWDDFAGTVDEGERKKGLRAGAVATFDAWWEYSFSECPVKLRDGGDSGFVDITIKFERFASASAFSKKLSWKDLAGLSAEQQAALLAHEQGHFDLAEVFRRRWQTQADAVAAKLTAEQKTKTERANERNRDLAMRVLRQQLFDALKKELQDLEKLRKQLLKELEAAQKAYDAYTGHGSNGARQAEWAAWIAGQLGANPPAQPPPGS